MMMMIIIIIIIHILKKIYTRFLGMVWNHQAATLEESEIAYGQPCLRSAS